MMKASDFYIIKPKKKTKPKTKPKTTIEKKKKKTRKNELLQYYLTQEKILPKNGKIRMNARNLWLFVESNKLNATKYTIPHPFMIMQPMIEDPPAKEKKMKNILHNGDLPLKKRLGMKKSETRTDIPSNIPKSNYIFRDGKKCKKGYKRYKKSEYCVKNPRNPGSEARKIADKQLENFIS